MKENYPEKIVENCGDLIFALDGEGIVRYINRKIEEFGYSREEIIGEEFSSFMIRDGLLELLTGCSAHGQMG